MLSETLTLEEEVTKDEQLGRDDHLVSIRDAARIIGVPAHTIRYWEKEFSEFLNPPRTTGKQRRYGDLHLERLKVIFHLLKEQGYSIAGARRSLSHRPHSESAVLSGLPVTPMAPAAPDFKGTTLEHFSSEMAEKIMAMVRNELHFA
jgi:DNA-binding transcriptional MerR regulator